MVAWFAEVIQREETSVAADRFEPITIGSPVATLLTRQAHPCHGRARWPSIQYRTERVNFQLGRNRSEMLRLIFAMGKIRGTLRMRSHTYVHRATTKYFSNSFVFKTTIEKEGLPRGSPAGLGAGGLEFKSPRPDQLSFAQ